MATKKSPLTEMKEKFKDKDALVERLLGLVELGETTKEEMKSRLLSASNKKLLRLFEVSSEIKAKYGSTQGLAEAAARAMGKAKDKDYVGKLAKLAQRTPSRVLDLVRSVKGAQG